MHNEHPERSTSNHRGRKTVTFVTEVMMHYRTPFHKLVRELLDSQGVDYTVVYGDPGIEQRKKNDTVGLDWGVATRRVELFGGTFVWLRCPPIAYRSDLVIVGQENRLVLNYWLITLRKLHVIKRLALWGHGRNFQSRLPGGLAEKWKRTWSKSADWFFAYTEASSGAFQGLGIRENHITVFHNSIDTTEIRKWALSNGDVRKRPFRGIFVGALYGEKRLPFLVAAADIIRSALPDFDLVIVGDGPERSFVEDAALTRPWLSVTGALHGPPLASEFQASSLCLMPGLVGLGVLDAFALGVPVVATAYPYHSPEAAYLVREASVVVDDWQSAEAFAMEAISLFQSQDRISELALGALGAGQLYSVENMARSFVNGVLLCLQS